MEKFDIRQNHYRRKLPAALLSGSLLVGNMFFGAHAVAAPPPELRPVATNQVPPQPAETFAVQQLSAEQVAAPSRIQLLAQHALRVVKVPHHRHRRHVYDQDALYAAWSKVATCEEGGWVGSSGYDFPNSLGITRANWFDNGGGSDVSPAAQIEVGERMIHRYGIDIPDQDGCDPGGW
ncbi:MAG TPA: hypothetical protein VG992_03595 [Candidatus Saccharimonadales bacterium]|nr:hypothetical protein [Candidatus Saccharimonadales bacterium]